MPCSSAEYHGEEGGSMHLSRMEGDTIRTYIHRTGIYGLMTLTSSTSAPRVPDSSGPTHPLTTPSLYTPAMALSALLALAFMGFRYKRM